MLEVLKLYNKLNRHAPFNIDNSDCKRLTTNSHDRAAANGRNKPNFAQITGSKKRFKTEMTLYNDIHVNIETTTHKRKH